MRGSKRPPFDDTEIENSDFYGNRLNNEGGTWTTSRESIFLYYFDRQVSLIIPEDLEIVHLPS